MTTRKEHALALFAGLPGHYDLIAALFSFGQDPRWRRTMCRRLRLSTGDRVLDVATGTGLVAESLVKGSGCSVVALDQSEAMLGQARRRVAAQALLRERVTIVRGEAEHLPFSDGEFDALTFTYLLRYVDDPGVTMRELARVVKPGGQIPGAPAAAGLALLHLGWSAPARPLGVPGLVRGRALSRPEHRRVLRAVSPRARRRPLAGGRDRRRPSTANEPRRGRHHVGGER
jgi:demethylmenaquinone methyltransferase/2-methoxy-6-polyprenyl-1,4-benzoquinol methylase